MPEKHEMSEQCKKAMSASCESNDDCMGCKGLFCYDFGQKSACISCKQLTIQSDCSGQDGCKWGEYMGMEMCKKLCMKTEAMCKAAKGEMHKTCMMKKADG